MDQVSARSLLGVEPDVDGTELRRAFRRAVSRVHPDVSSAVDAAEKTVELTEAYALLRNSSQGSDATAFSEAKPTEPTRRATSTSTEARADHTQWDATPTTVVMTDDDTIAVSAPSDSTLLMLLEAAHNLGEVIYLDPSAGLLEVIVEFVEAPTSSVLMSMQGRSNGTTEVFCTVDPLSGGQAPPTASVTRLIAATLTDVIGEIAFP